MAFSIVRPAENMVESCRVKNTRVLSDTPVRHL